MVEKPGHEEVRMMTLLETKALNAGYGPLQILWNIDFKVEEKSVTALIGANGAGKTTLIKVLTGLLKPYSGHVFFKGVDVTGYPAHRMRQMGLSLVPEGRRLFPNLTVMDNLLMGAYMLRRQDEFEERLEIVLELFPVLKERRNQPARLLSGGEAQMLAIARALITPSDLLIVDEPSSGLAPKLVDLIFKKLEELRETGLTILVVDQFVERALSISDTAYVMENGKIAIQGPSTEVANNEHLKKTYLGL
ncbi:branched-chain amino acid ABC transporter ATP-binding protein [Candidatus Caldarchaeum subterraneum]|mgnify:CR=1 FL=1|uniref:Branched-chain amino acid ABC transporter ATP-binding protein n=2 Tax=Thermoproteati TaxID=1783275 RepID=E6N866_CALS0|nr:branched-chain amino acid ABC transporter ATP-binding protein [Candidatus Caldarchaeum subterraneum]BAJ49624.1 branched-chain amino acid ABC transporter ATP-binding protein [Candidatus Caldarchaeum subterraneum]BAJ51236.1 branched-chain amino acid ABC transporter ATP-binding protein [Candidatus Caldarchaeum subterraneum]